MRSSVHRGRQSTSTFGEKMARIGQVFMTRLSRTRALSTTSFRSMFDIRDFQVWRISTSG